MRSSPGSSPSEHSACARDGDRRNAQRSVYGDGFRAFRAWQNHSIAPNRSVRQRNQDVTASASLRRGVSPSEMVFPSRYQAE